MPLTSSRFNPPTIQHKYQYRTKIITFTVNLTNIKNLYFFIL